MRVEMKWLVVGLAGLLLLAALSGVTITPQLDIGAGNAEVVVKSPIVAEELRSAIAQTQGMGIYRSDFPLREEDIALIEELWFGERTDPEQYSLEGIEKCESLRRVHIHEPEQIVDLSMLEKVRHLEELEIRNARDSDLLVAADLPGLRVLRISGPEVTDISPLSAAVGLTELYITCVGLSNLSPISDLNLRVLSLECERGTSLTHISGMGTLEDLVLAFEFPHDGFPSLAGLIRFLAVGCGIEEIDFIQKMPMLEGVNLGANQIADVSPIAELQHVTEIYLHSNLIEDISPLADLTTLRFLEVSGNRISDIDAIAQLPALARLGLANNRIVDFDPLLTMPMLSGVWLWGNPAETEAPQRLLETIEQLKGQGIILYEEP